jgi:hypothetical protein
MSLQEKSSSKKPSTPNIKSNGQSDEGQTTPKVFGAKQVVKSNYGLRNKKQKVAMDDE